MLKILDEKSTSSLFARVDKVIQLYCCSTCSRKSNAKHKYTQNSIVYNDSIVSTPQTKAVSEFINTDRKKYVNSCGNSFRNEYSFNSDSDKTKLSDVEKEYFPKMYRVDEAKNFLDAELNKDNSFKQATKLDRKRNYPENAKKKFRHGWGPSSCCAEKNTGVQVTADEKCLARMKDRSERCKFNKKSFASIYTIYRKNKNNAPKFKNEPSYVGDMEMSENSNEIYNDAVEGQNIYENATMGKTYCCKLKNQTQNVREKMSNLYRVCSKKFIGQCRKIPISLTNAKTCPQGICRDAKTDNYPKPFTENSKKCSDSCSAMKLYNKLQNRMKRKNLHHTKNMKFQNVEVQNEKEQTGEPLFEMKVDNIGMCVLNSTEIKDKVLRLGKEKKKDKCICPSHAAREKYILKREACSKGICKKMLKDKETEFTCKCLKNKVWVCNDATCGKARHGGTNVSTLHTKPLFEIQVDKENMCIINPDEIRNKMKDIDKRSRNLCYQGICRNKSKEKLTRVNCKCNKSRQIGECDEKSCTRKIIKRNNHLRGNISGPYAVHPRTSFRNARNKLTSMCSLVISKSENYCNCIRRRKRRQQRRQCNTMLCNTQSDNVNNRFIKNSIHRRAGLTIKLKRKWSNSDCIPRNCIDKNEILHAAHADCCPCNVHSGIKHRVARNRQKNFNKSRVKLVSCLLRKKTKKKKEFDCLNYQKRNKADKRSNNSPCDCDDEKLKQSNPACPCDTAWITQQQIMSVDSTMRDNQKPKKSKVRTICGCIKQRNTVCPSDRALVTQQQIMSTIQDNEKRKQKKGSASCDCIDIYNNEIAKQFDFEQGTRKKRKKLQPFVSADYTTQKTKRNRRRRKGRTICTCIVTQGDKDTKIGKILARLAQAMSSKSVCTCEDVTDSSQSTKNKLKLLKPVKKDNRNIIASDQSKTVKRKRDNSLCKCHHICECRDAELRAKSKADQKRQNKARKQDSKKKLLTEREKRKKQEKLKRIGMQKKNKKEEKMKSLQQQQKKNKKRMKSKEEHKRWLLENKEKRKRVLKEKKIAMKEEEKRRKIQIKRDREVLAALESEGGKQPNCCVVILETIFSLVFKSIGGIFYALFKLIISPVKSGRYIKERFYDREGTLVLIKRKLQDAWRIRKLKIMKCIGNSETMSILSDTLQDTALFQAMADKGKTKKDQERIELEAKKRKKRIIRRQEQALYGCRHSLLNTLRKTPCLWFYHVCPNMYPQCLSFVTFMRNFWHLCLFVSAVACWTPCILLFEIMRALCCCILCTG